MLDAREDGEVMLRVQTILDLLSPGQHFLFATL